MLVFLQWALGSSLISREMRICELMSARVSGLKMTLKLCNSTRVNGRSSEGKATSFPTLQFISPKSPQVLKHTLKIRNWWCRLGAFAPISHLLNIPLLMKEKLMWLILDRFILKSENTAFYSSPNTHAQNTLDGVKKILTFQFHVEKVLAYSKGFRFRSKTLHASSTQWRAFLTRKPCFILFCFKLPEELIHILRVRGALRLANSCSHRNLFFPLLPPLDYPEIALKGEAFQFCWY